MQADLNSQNCIINNITTSTLNLYEEMLSDEVKMLSFKYAIQNNKEIFKDKVIFIFYFFVIFCNFILKIRYRLS